MAKYNVYYSGQAYVEADSVDEAIAKYQTDYIYDEKVADDIVKESDAVMLGV